MLIMVSAVDSPQFYDSDSTVAGPIQVRAYYCSSVFYSGLGIVTGNPRVFEGYPYPYPPKTRTRAQGKGFHGYGSRVLRVIRVKKPARRVVHARRPWCHRALAGEASKVPLSRILVVLLQPLAIH